MRRDDGGGPDWTNSVQHGALAQLARDATHSRATSRPSTSRDFDSLRSLCIGAQTPIKHCHLVAIEGEEFDEKTKKQKNKKSRSCLTSDEASTMTTMSTAAARRSRRRRAIDDQLRAVAESTEPTTTILQHTNVGVFGVVVVVIVIVIIITMRICGSIVDISPKYLQRPSDRRTEAK